MTAVHQARKKPALHNEGQSSAELNGACTRPRERQKRDKPTCQPYAFIPTRRNKSRKVGIPRIEVHKLPSIYSKSRWITKTSFNRQHYLISQQYADPNIHWRQDPKSHFKCKRTETKQNRHFSTQSALSQRVHHKYARKNPQAEDTLVSINRLRRCAGLKPQNQSRAQLGSVTLQPISSSESLLCLRLSGFIALLYNVKISRRNIPWDSTMTVPVVKYILRQHTDCPCS
jgi:hypothetical protein